MIMEGQLNLVGTAYVTGWGGFMKASALEVGGTTLLNVRMETYMRDRLNAGEHVRVLVKRLFGLRMLLGIQSQGRVYKTGMMRLVSVAVLVGAFCLYGLLHWTLLLTAQARSSYGLSVKDMLLSLIFILPLVWGLYNIFDVFRAWIRFPADQKPRT